MIAAKHLNRHASMMNRMAQQMGGDLSMEMAAGRLSGEAWKDALIRCTKCREAGACLLWLAEHDPQMNPAKAPPAYCENRLMMTQLRATIGAEPEGVE
ncbi:hypothetical protein B6V74_07165 [Thioclava sp. F42-5]|uniref:DUF6455 family protein n=1 Tax=Thioclava sp. F42-5 TaxID=1973005 RepID=UPI000B5393E5|nr:DUF6455 family protein [Thioclava sp. F42-5]OWY09787.1 hypothetical protein B6V74_07165 [Thioclava sp. F42-5]